MAKPSWISVDKSSDSGNGTVTVTVEAYTGSQMEASRSTGTLTFRAGNVTKTVTVTQSSAAESVTATTNTLKGTIDAAGGSFTISGKANTGNISLILNSGTTDILSAAPTVTVNGTEIPMAKSGNTYSATIPNGAYSQYSYTITGTVGENTSSSATRQMKYKIGGGSFSTSVITATQSSASVEFNVEPTTLTYLSDGTPVDEDTISVTSGTSWTIS